MKSITVAQGERAKILSRFSNSLQMTYRFDAEPVHAAMLVPSGVGQAEF